MADLTRVGGSNPQVILRELANKQRKAEQEEVAQQQHSIQHNYQDNTAETLSFFDYQATLAKVDQNSTPELKTTQEQLIDKKDVLSCLSNIWIYGLEELDESKLEVARRSDGNITDIYYDNMRYCLRYDAQGNLAKTISMTLDEDGKVARQDISEWKNGNVSTSIRYAYQYDENGNQIGQTRNAIDYNYGSAFKVLNDIFGENIICPCVLFGMDLQVNKTQDGKITDFVFRGVHYSLRYDENGSLSKAFTQKLDDEGRVIEHNVTEYNEDGSIKDVKNYSYEYNITDMVFSTMGASKVTTQRDANGNIVQKIVMDLDENGEVRGQNITNYNSDGSEKNTIYYRYGVNEAGEQTQSRVAIDAKYNPASLLSLCGERHNGMLISYDHIPKVGEVPPPFYDGVGNIERNQNGQIVSFTYEGNRYAFNYDENGNVSKAVAQKMDKVNVSGSNLVEVQKEVIVEQRILEFGENGEKIKHLLYTYEYDSNTGERIGGTKTDLINDIEPVDTKQGAIDAIKQAYASKVTDDTLCEEESERLNKFIENDVIAELKSVGVSAQEMEDLLNELFPTLKENNDLAKLQGTSLSSMVTANIDAPFTLLKQLYSAYKEDAPFLTEKSKRAFAFLEDPENRKDISLFSMNHMARNKVLSKLKALELPSNMRLFIIGEIQNPKDIGTKKTIG